jgi:adenylyltransferase/sulfurtransferase
MPVTVSIPIALRQFTDGGDTITLDGGDVGQVLTRLGEQHPRLRPHLFSDEGKLRNYVNVYVNDENVRDLQDQQTPVKDGDEVVIVPAIAGGY